MKKNILKEEIKWFVIQHPKFIDTEEKIFTPKKGVILKIWFEGCLQIEGKYKQLEKIITILI